VDITRNRDRLPYQEIKTGESNNFYQEPFTGFNNESPANQFEVPNWVNPNPPTIPIKA
jgi:hypothetical protein